MSAPTSPTLLGGGAASPPNPTSPSPPAKHVTTVKLSLEVVKIKRIPPREFEGPASSVVTLHPQLISYRIPATPKIVGSGVRAAMSLAAFNQEGGDDKRSPLEVETELAPNVFSTEQVFNTNDPYYNDKVEFTAELPDAGEDDHVAGPDSIQGYPAGVVIPPIGPDGRPLPKTREAPAPPAQGPAAQGLGSSLRGRRRSTLTGSSPPPLPHAGGSGPAVANAADSSASASLAAKAFPPQAPKQPHFKIPVEIHDHNKPANPVLILGGLLEIPMVTTKGDLTLCVALAPTPPPTKTAPHGSGEEDANQQQHEQSTLPPAISSAPIKDEIDVVAPLLCVRYRVTVVKPAKEPVDRHADVLLEEEPRYTPDHQLVPDVTQYSWYHLLNDRPWLLNFSQALIAQWSVLPKIVYEDPAAKPAKAKKARPGTAGAGGFASSSRRGTVAQVSYRSVADLMLNHWSVKRSHEVLSRTRIVADKYCRGEHMGFTAAEEYRLKLQWRERQVLRTTMAMDEVGTWESTSKVKSMLEEMWYIMVFGKSNATPSTADPAVVGANPPLFSLKTISSDKKTQLNKINFTVKHAINLRACMLQLLVSGLTWADALKIATEDFEPRNLTYVSRRGSQIGGEFCKSEGIMMAFGNTVPATMPPDMNEVSEIEQLHRLLEDNQKNIKTIQRRAKSRDKSRNDANGDGNNADGPGAAGDASLQMNQLGNTLGGTMAFGSTMAGGLDGTLNNTFAMATLAGVTIKEGGALDLGVGPNGCPRRPQDFPTPTNFTSQKVFITVVIDFVGRLLETLTDHEFIMILQHFVPAVVAANQKMPMTNNLGGTVTNLMSSTKSRSGSARKKVGSAKRLSSSAVAAKKAKVAEVAAPSEAGHITHTSGINIEYLDSLGRKLPKKDLPPTAAGENDGTSHDEGGDAAVATTPSVAEGGSAEANADAVVE